MDSGINYKIICFDNDIFSEIEEEIFQHYPLYKKKNNIFLVNGMKVEKNQTIKQNNIQAYAQILIVVET